MVEIYAIRIDDSYDNRMYNQFIPYISKKKREQIDKFHFSEDAKRTLYGDLMVRFLACNKLKMRNNELKFIFNAFGKPFLKNCNKFYFNISHSGVWVVCIISEKEVGIDVEKINPVDINSAKSYFTEYEYGKLMQKSEKVQLEYFYDLWTLKESYIKCIGIGLVSLYSFNICVENLSIISSFYPLKLHLSKVFLDREYKLSVCSQDDWFVSDVKLLTMNDIKEVLLYGN